MPKPNDYVCVRSKDQGVVWGILVWRSGRECCIREARQQYSWSDNATTLFDVIKKGPKITNLRLSETIEEIEMTEICGIMYVPPEMAEEFKNHPAS